MARTAQTVRDLVSQDEEMEAALEVLLEHEGERLDWADVNDDLTSGQWGRLIETGVLEESGDGFTLADPDAVRTGLYGPEETSEADGEAPEVSWTTWDKIAGVLALSLFPGYYFEPVRNTVGGLVDLLFAPVDAVLPFYAVILVVAVLTGLYSTLLQANLMDMDAMSYYQNQMKELQDRKEAAKERGDEEELQQINQEQMEQMGEQLGMFKMQFRPMVWIMLLTIPAFLWMYWKILPGGGAIDGATTVVLPLIGQVEWTTGIVGPFQTWIFWYFLCSMGFSQIIRKSLNIQTTPT